MRSLSVFFLLASSALAPAFAADFNATSKVDRVTVYPQGADVTRIAEITIPAGDHRIILADLPATVDPRSIRVEGEGNSKLEIASVDTRNFYISAEEQDAKRKALEKEIEKLNDQRGALDTVINDANQQRAILLSLADKQFVPQSTEQNLKGIDVVQLTSLLDLVSTRLAAQAKVIQDATGQQKLIDEKVNELNNQISQLAPANAYRLEAAINVSAAAEMKGALRVSYRLNEAGWLPYYDARITMPEKDGPAPLEIIRRAEVIQSTSEMWENVELVLSTTRPTGSTAAPDIGEEEIRILAEVEAGSTADQRLRKLKRSASAEDAESVYMAEEPVAGAAPEPTELALAPKPVSPAMIEQKQAQIQLAGFQANYVIPGRVTVDNSGTAKKVRIASNTHQSKLEVISVPRVDTNAYLTAAFVVEGSGPLLPGYVNLYRDGVFMGQGDLPLLSPNEEAKLGFGTDDLVKIERKEVKKKEGEEGLLTSSNVRELAWDITVKNLHESKIAVKVLDRMPFTAVKDVEISVLPGMTDATDKAVDKKRGVMSWSFELEPLKDTVIKTGYRVSWPETVKIGLVD